MNEVVDPFAFGPTAQQSPNVVRAHAPANPFATTALPSVAATHGPVMLAGVLVEPGTPASPAPDLATHRAWHGMPVQHGHRAKRHLHEVEAIARDHGIKGRGGANFPLADKMAAVARERRRPIVVVNAAEGEPASGKDLVLMTSAPHLVLDGALTSARVLGAKEIVIWLHHGSPALNAIRRAVQERTTIDHDVTYRIAQAPDRFVAGQVTSVVRGLSGGPALPYTAREQVSEKGINGRPTLASNAETYALLAVAVQHGPETAGQLLTTVMDEHGRRTVVESRRGTPILDILGAAGVDSEGLPVLVGGYAGAWIGPREIRRATLDDRVLTEPAVRLGVALFAVPSRQWCPVALTSLIVTWLASQSAGQCGPCTFGLPATAEALARMAASQPRPEDRDHLVRWLPMLSGRGACAHPDGVVGLVRSTGEVFAEHLWQHVKGEPCAGSGLVPPWPSLHRSVHDAVRSASNAAATTTGNVLPRTRGAR